MSKPPCGWSWRWAWATPPGLSGLPPGKGPLPVAAGVGGWPVGGEGHSRQLWSQVTSEGVGAEAVRVDMEGSRVSGEELFPE